MSSIKEYIESGILEQYALGQCSEAEAQEVERMAAEHDEVSLALIEAQETLEAFALANAVEPNPTVKTFLMATLDYMERLENGEAPTIPPSLDADSTAADYTPWLEREDMQFPEDFNLIHAKLIGYTPKEVTAIVWIGVLAPQEVHDDEFEKFLVLEGTCDITVGDQVHSLKAGDFLAIPLHVDHDVKVTSDIPCKVILQRTAA